MGFSTSYLKTFRNPRILVIVFVIPTVLGNERYNTLMSTIPFSVVPCHPALATTDGIFGPYHTRFYTQSRPGLMYQGVEIKSDITVYDVPERKFLNFSSVDHKLIKPEEIIEPAPLRNGKVTTKTLGGLILVSDTKKFFRVNSSLRCFARNFYPRLIVHGRLLTSEIIPPITIPICKQENSFIDGLRTPKHYFLNVTRYLLAKAVTGIRHNIFPIACHPSNKPIYLEYSTYAGNYMAIYLPGVWNRDILWNVDSKIISVSVATIMVISNPSLRPITISIRTSFDDFASLDLTIPPLNPPDLFPPGSCPCSIRFVHDKFHLFESIYFPDFLPSNFCSNYISISSGRVRIPNPRTYQITARGIFNVSRSAGLYNGLNTFCVHTCCESIDYDYVDTRIVVLLGLIAGGTLLITIKLRDSLSLTISCIVFHTLLGISIMMTNSYMATSMSLFLISSMIRLFCLPSYARWLSFLSFPSLVSFILILGFYPPPILAMSLPSISLHTSYSMNDLLRGFNWFGSGLGVLVACRYHMPVGLTIVLLFMVNIFSVVSEEISIPYSAGTCVDVQDASFCLKRADYIYRTRQLYVPSECTSDIKMDVYCNGGIVPPKCNSTNPSHFCMVQNVANCPLCYLDEIVHGGTCFAGVKCRHWHGSIIPHPSRLIVVRPSFVDYDYKLIVDGEELSPTLTESFKIRKRIFYIRSISGTPPTLSDNLWLNYHSSDKLSADILVPNRPYVPGETEFLSCYIDLNGRVSVDIDKLRNQLFETGHVPTYPNPTLRLSHGTWFTPLISTLPVGCVDSMSEGRLRITGCGVGTLVLGYNGPTLPVRPISGTVSYLGLQNVSCFTKDSFYDIIIITRGSSGYVDLTSSASCKPNVLMINKDTILNHIICFSKPKTNVVSLTIGDKSLKVAVNCDVPISDSNLSHPYIALKSTDGISLKLFGPKLSFGLDYVKYIIGFFIMIVILFVLMKLFNTTRRRRVYEDMSMVPIILRRPRR